MAKTKFFVFFILMCASVAFAGVKLASVTVTDCNFGTDSHRNYALDLALEQNCTFVKVYDMLPVGTASSTDLNANHANGSKKATFTAARSASAPATYVDASGMTRLVTTANVGRIQGGYNDTSGFVAQKGLMVEGAMTNYCLDSYFGRALANDNWSSSYGTITDTADSNSDISGAKVRRVEYTYTGSEINYSSLLNQSTGTDTFDASAANIPVTVSFKARGNLSGITNGTDIASFVKIDELNNAEVYQRSPIAILLNTVTTLSETEWREFTYSANVTDTDTRRLKLYFVQIGSASKPTAGENAWIEVTEVQIEKSPYATSYVPSATSALTRPAETLTYATAGNRTAEQESIFIKFAPGGAFANDGIERFGDNTATKSRHLIRKLTTYNKLESRPNSTDSSLCSVRSTPDISSYVSIVASVVFKHSSPYISQYIDGVSSGTETSDDYTNPAWGANFYIGSSASASYHLNGIIQSIAIYSDAKNATDVAKITNYMED